MNVSEAERIAQLFIDTYGDGANSEAQRRVRVCMARGDENGVEDWRRVSRTITSLKQNSSAEHPK